ncbi:MAG: glycosyltransferase family 1 protein [Anaerolineales bacterium]|nr:glycosyltransferase family 1 protein [Anaerolineales bacterium]
MNITILTYGSRGDVQPFLPLSLGLMARGHQVRLAAPPRFKNFVEAHGVSFSPLAGDPEDLSRRFNNSGFNSLKQVRDMLSHAVEIGAEMLHKTEEACRDADLIIHTFAHAVGAHTLAREKHIPDLHIQTFPMFTPTGDYPNVTLPGMKVPALNRLTHLAAQRITWWTSRFGYQQIRRRAGLPARKLYFPFDGNSLRPPTPILCAWSPSVLPPSNDWRPNVHVTGYFFFDSITPYQPSRELQTFLMDGEPPVCVTFGSMMNRDAERIDHIVRDALRHTGQRGVILSGWGKVNRPSSKEFLYLDEAPHDWLLPCCKMLIHHGGAGTTSAGLRAGIPNIVIPFTADQPFWGWRVYALRAGPKPIFVKRLSVERLAKAIAQAETKDLRIGAQEIGRRIRSEAGVERAIALIETHISSWENFKV